MMKIIYEYNSSATIILLLYFRCNVQWYIAPLHIQRLLLFLLLRVTKSFNVVIGGIFIASLEGFAMVKFI